MLTLDYNSVINNQYYNAEKSKKSLYFFNSGVGKVINSFFSPKFILRKVNSILTSQLISSRGLLITAKENCLEIKDKDTSKGIEGVNRLLDLNICINSMLDEFIENKQGDKYPELFLSKEIVVESIENYYSILRILKVANTKKPKETSELAKNLSNVSVKSLEKVLYGR